MLNEIDLSRADLNLLVLFEAVFQERHVGRAAIRLNLTPSAVSHGLGRLRRLLNDPLFLRTPKGVIPTDRATELAALVTDILSRTRSVLAISAPFDPATATRRFTIGAPDGVSAVFLPALLAELRQSAPGVGISLRQLMPVSGEPSPERAWRSSLAEMEAGALDIAVIPSDNIPARFQGQTLYEEDFVIAMRAGHGFAHSPTLGHYCDALHLVVSASGDPEGFVDTALTDRGRSRRIALTVPNFMLALAVLAETDLISAVPRRFVGMHARRFGIVAVDAPLPLRQFRLNAVATKAAMMDAGVAWLFEMLSRNTQDASEPSTRARPKTQPL